MFKRSFWKKVYKLLVFLLDNWDAIKSIIEKKDLLEYLYENRAALVSFLKVYKIEMERTRQKFAQETQFKSDYDGHLPDAMSQEDYRKFIDPDSQ